MKRSHCRRKERLPILLFLFFTIPVLIFSSQTQDTRAAIQETDSTKKELWELINKERQRYGLPSLEWRQDTEELANNFAERKASGQALPEIPQSFGEAFVVFLSTPVLVLEELNFPEAVYPRYRGGSLGIWLGKNKDYPGGVYSFALMLFVEGKPNTLSIEEQKNNLLELVNEIRIQNGLIVLAHNERLSKTAERLASNAAKGKRSERLKTRGDIQYKTFTYTYGTADLTLLPGPLKKILRETQLRKIGIAIVEKNDSVSQRGTFFVSFLFE